MGNFFFQRACHHYNEENGPREEHDWEIVEDPKQNSMTELCLQFHDVEKDSLLILDRI